MSCRRLLAILIGSGIALSSVAEQATPPKTVRTWFDVDTHGWHFANDRFKVCAAPTCQPENSLTLLGGESFEWALCGGMSVAALRHYINEVQIEPYSAQLKDQELVPTQIDTVQHWGQTFLWWQARPDHGDDHRPAHQHNPQRHASTLVEPRPDPTRRLAETSSPHTIGWETKQEWPRIKSLLDRGFPVHLGIVRAGPSRDASLLGKHHQVLAIGYREYSQPGQIDLIVYDPNHPRKESVIVFHTDRPNNQINSGQVTDGQWERVRGFFTMSFVTFSPDIPASYFIPTI